MANKSVLTVKEVLTAELLLGVLRGVEECHLMTLPDRIMSVHMALKGVVIGDLYEVPSSIRKELVNLDELVGENPRYAVIMACLKLAEMGCSDEVVHTLRDSRMIMKRSRVN